MTREGIKTCLVWLILLCSSAALLWLMARVLVWWFAGIDGNV